MRRRIQAILMAVLLSGAVAISGCGPGSEEGQNATETTQEAERGQETEQEEAEPEEGQKAQETPDTGAGAEVDLSSIPAYSGSPYVALNGNVPDFTAEDLTATSYESYGELDSLGRCGVCIASIGRDLMPTEDREGIGSVKPTGWHTVKYNGLVDGNYLYNRCHLIGFQLSGENANEQNLITGTRYLNVDGMLPFENMVADYVKETGNHVLYRVTPVFEGDNLLASGVVLEAQSVEDQGEGIQFHVYCYNVQPGISINYADGSSQFNGSQPAEGSSDAAQTEIPAATGQTDAGQTSGEDAFAVNPRNGKIHQTGQCPATGTGGNAMSNPQYFATYEEAEAYSKQVAPDQAQRQCGNCW